MSTARVVSRTAAALVAALLWTLAGVALSAQATTAEPSDAAPVDADVNLGMAFGGPVGSIAIGIGILGFVLGLVRHRRKSAVAGNRP